MSLHFSKILFRDLLNFITRFFSYEDYCNFICCSKYIYNLMEDVPFNLDITLYSIDFIKEKLKPLRSFPNVPNLYFNKRVYLMNNAYSTYIQFEETDYLKKSMEHIKEFHFNSYYATNFYNHRKELKLLKYIHNKYNSETSDFKKPIQSCIILDVNTILNQVLQHSKNLIHLEIRERVHIIDKSCVLHNLSNKLKILNFSGIVNMNDRFMDIITNRCSHLEKLDVSHSHVSDIGLIYLERLEKLKSFIIAFNAKITNTGFSILGDIKSLRKLDTTMCHFISDGGVLSLVRKNPNLTHLTFECMNIGQSSVNYMVEYLKEPLYINLNYISFSQFINVSSLKEKCKVITYKKT